MDEIIDRLFGYNNSENIFDVRFENKRTVRVIYRVRSRRFSIDSPGQDDERIKKFRYGDYKP